MYRVQLIFKADNNSSIISIITLTRTGTGTKMEGYLKEAGEEPDYLAKILF